MDVHIVPGVQATDVAQAHHKDLLLQDSYGCKCMTYWIDEKREKVFCLIDAPSKEIVTELHSRAHGLIPNKVIEVDNSVVESFLGRIYDPEEAETNAAGLKVFHDPSFRILLVTKTIDPVLLQYKLGKEEATDLIKKQNEIIIKQVSLFGGNNVEHAGEGFIVSFSVAAKAISCALSIREEIEDAGKTGFRIGIHCGEPVEKSNHLFGDTIQMARQLCNICKERNLSISGGVKDLVSADHIRNEKVIFTLSPSDEAALESICHQLEANWHDPEFNIADYCQAMAMSKSQLYRKSVDLFDLSPNHLLKEYRLEKAKELLKKRKYTISQITYDSGFTSPSYFTKCFKKKYGLLPMDYLELLQ